MRRAVRSVIGFLLTILFVCPVSADSLAPASPAQLQALENQIAALKAQQQAAYAELNKANNKITEVNLDVKLLDTLSDTSNELTPPTGIQGAADELKLQAAVKAAKFKKLMVDLKAAQQRRDAAAQRISDLDGQIVQLQAKLNYWRNPVQSDLESERAHLRNLETQKDTSDESGQRARDIDSTRQRIKQLQDEFNRQQSGSSGGSRSQSGPAQPSAYTAPPQPPPTAAAPPPPMLPPSAYLTGFQVYCPAEVAAGQTVRCTATGVYSHDPYTAVDLTGSTDWQITGAPGWRGGSEFGTKGASTIIVTATRGSMQATRTVHVKTAKTGMDGGTKPQSTGTGKPAGGGGCGPGTSCKCAGGATGHISCDTGKCHCGGG